MHCWRIDTFTHANMHACIIREDARKNQFKSNLYTDGQYLLDQAQSNSIVSLKNWRWKKVLVVLILQVNLLCRAIVFPAWFKCSLKMLSECRPSAFKEIKKVDACVCSLGGSKSCENQFSALVLVEFLKNYSTAFQCPEMTKNGLRNYDKTQKLHGAKRCTHTQDTHIYIFLYIYIYIYVYIYLYTQSNS